MFFVAVALLLVTAGVFAGKARFVSYTLQAYNGGVYTPLSTTNTFVPSVNLSLVTSGTPISFTSTVNSGIYSIYALSSTSVEYKVQTTF